MSQLNPLEKQLCSWTPRAPSPNLEARLFGVPVTESGLSLPERTAAPAAWHWLAPAMAVFVFGAFVVGNHPGAFHHFDGASSSSVIAAAAITQPDFSTYYADARHSENNALRGTFEWTNGSRSLRTTPPMAQTNSVMQ